MGNNKGEQPGRRLDCGAFDPEDLAKLVNDMAVRGTPMRYMRRRQGARSVQAGYVMSASVDGDGNLMAVVEDG